MLARAEPSSPSGFRSCSKSADNKESSFALFPCYRSFLFDKELIIESKLEKTEFFDVARRAIYLDAEALERECRMERLRRSGPGGQNRNKVETAVRFYHLPTGLVGEASERRYQGENRRVALERLRLEIALNVRGARRVEKRADDETLALRDAATFRWFARLIAGKIRVAPTSFDYPILVSEFFDVYRATDENLAQTAFLLKTTPSQIVRLLSAVPKCLETLNRARVVRALPRLK